MTTGQTMSLNATVEYKISENWKSATSALYASGNDEGYEVRMVLLPNVVKGVISALLSGNLANIDYGTPGADYMGRMTRKFETSVNTHQIQQNFVGDFKIGERRNRMVIGLDYYFHDNQSYWRSYQSNKYGSLFGYAYPSIFDVVALNGENSNYYNFEKNNIDYLYETAQTDVSKKPFGGTTRIYSAYVNDVLNITDRLLVNAGVRFDRFIAKGIYDGTTNSWSEGYNQNAVSPKFGIVYQPILNMLSLFANYQTGFTNKNGTDKNNKIFNPEHSYQFETGVKYALFDGNFTGTLSVYDIRVKDIVRNDPENIDFNMQDGTQKSRGFEAEILGNPFPNFNIMLGYAYNDSKYEKADESVNGLRPTTAGAKNQFNVWLHYHFQTYNLLNNFSIGAGGNYVGKTYAMNQAPDGAFIVPAYTLVNAKISYDKPSYSLALRANNLLNLDIWAGNAGIFPQMPRQILGSVALKF
jgi:iron complex outermembrane receptor protein